MPVSMGAGVNGAVRLPVIVGVHLVVGGPVSVAVNVYGSKFVNVCGAMCVSVDVCLQGGVILERRIRVGVVV